MESQLLGQFEITKEQKNVKKKFQLYQKINA